MNPAPECPISTNLLAGGQLATCRILALSVAAKQTVDVLRNLARKTLFPLMLVLQALSWLVLPRRGVDNLKPTKEQISTIRDYGSAAFPEVNGEALR